MERKSTDEIVPKGSHSVALFKTKKFKSVYWELRANLKLKNTGRKTLHNLTPKHWIWSVSEDKIFNQSKHVLFCLLRLIAMSFSSDPTRHFLRLSWLSSSQYFVVYQGFKSSRSTRLCVLLLESIKVPFF
jgi:hypothetical protein